MPEVLISFVDGEVMHASIDDLTFDIPVIAAEIQSIDPNCELALFPLASIRQMIVGNIEQAPDPEELEQWDKTAFHFVDGQVLRAWIAPDAVLGRHGGIWQVVEPDSIEMRRFAIPYSALKGVYRLRQWDSRVIKDRTIGDGADQLARVMAERAAQSDETPVAQRALINRMRS